MKEKIKSQEKTKQAKAPKADHRAITAANKARRIAKAAAQAEKALAVAHGAARKLRRELRIIIVYSINGVTHKRTYERADEDAARVRIAVLRGEGVHVEVKGLMEGENVQA